MADLFQNLYLPGGDQSELSPTFGQTVKSAFGLENDLTNFYDYMTRPAYTPDLSFDFNSAFNRDKLPLEWKPILAATQSEEEYRAKLGQIQKEYKSKAVLAASGWSGTVAAIGAGILSPTSFIPFVGQGRRGWAIAEMIGLAAAGATAQNGALFLNQATRTEAELYTGIGMDTLLNGMLGGAWLGLSRAGRARLLGDMEFRQTQLSVPTGPADMGPVARTNVRTEAPVRAEYETRLRAPNEVRDAPATPAAKVEKLPQPETVRVYLSGNLADTGDEIVATVDREVAAAAVPDAPFYHVDLSATDARLAQPQVQLSLDEVKQLREVYRGSAADDGELPDLLRAVDEAEADELDMAASDGQAAIPEAASTRDPTASGAQVSRTRNTSGAAPAPNKVRQAAMNAVGKLSPQYRMLTNRFFPSLRNGIAKLDMSGLMQGNLAHAEPSADGGMVIERIKGYDPHIVEFAQTLDREFYNYLYDGAKGMDFNSPALAQLKSTFVGTPPGKMNWQEFKAAVFDGQNTGKFDPALANSVQAFDRFFKYYTDRQKQYLNEFAVNGIEAEPLFKELLDDELGEGATAYAHHIFDGRTLMEKMSEFHDEFSEFYERQLAESFTKDIARYQKRTKQLESEQQLADLPTEDLAAALDEVESDLEFLEEMPEWQAFREQRLEILRDGRANNTPKEQLKAELKQLQDSAPPTVLELQAERKQLMTRAKLMRKYGGNDGEKLAKLQADVKKADELIDGMFRLGIPKLQALDLSLAKNQSQGDKAISTATKELNKVVKALDKRRAQMHTLLQSKRINSTSRQKVQDHLDKLGAKYAGMLDRLSMVEGQQVALDVRLSELNLMREDAIADTTTLVRNRAARLGDLEEKLETAKSESPTPEVRARQRAQIGEELYANERDFELKWGKRGAGGEAAAGKADFREKAREMATLLHQKLTGSEVELSPVYHALRQDARGAELLRVMKMPYDLKQKWLVKDVETVTRAYDRVMAPDLEIWRAFDGSVNAKSLLGEMQDELTGHMQRIGLSNFVRLPKGWTDKAAKFSQRVADRLEDFGESDDLFLEAGNFSDVAKPGFQALTPELRTQLARAVTDAAKAQTRNLDVAINRLRGTRGVPQDANSMWYRGGRFVKNVNILTMMGGVVTSSYSDVSRPMYAHGVQRAYKQGWAPFIGKLTGTGKEFRIKSKEINRRIGLNIEPALHSRAQGLFDLAEDSIGKTKLERGVNLGAQKMGIVALYDYWTAGMKVIAGNVTHAVMAEYIPAVAKSFRDGVEPVGDLLEMRTYLRSKGLRDLDIHRIALQMEAPGGMEKFSNGGVLPNMGAWDDPVAYQAYQAAVLAEVNKLIVTPGLERPNIVDENMAYSMLFQFKSFVFASNSRMLMSNLQGTDPYLMQGLTFSLAFGALSYYAYAHTAGGKTLEKMQKAGLDDWAWEAVNRSGVLGALAIGGDIISEVPTLNGALPDRALFRKPTGLLGAVLGPTYTQATRMGEFIMNMGTDDAKQQARNMKTLRQVWLPYQNHFIFRRFFDRVGEAMAGG